METLRVGWTLQSQPKLGYYLRFDFGLVRDAVQSEILPGSLWNQYFKCDIVHQMNVKQCSQVYSTNSHFGNPVTDCNVCYIQSCCIIDDFKSSPHHCSTTSISTLAAFIQTMWWNFFRQLNVCRTLYISICCCLMFQGNRQSYLPYCQTSVKLYNFTLFSFLVSFIIFEYCTLKGNQGVILPELENLLLKNMQSRD